MFYLGWILICKRRLVDALQWRRTFTCFCFFCFLILRTLLLALWSVKVLCTCTGVSPITRRLLSLSHHHHHYICDLLWYCVCLCDGGVCLMKMNCQIAIASHSCHPISFTQLCFWKLKLLATLDFSSRAAAVNTAIYCHSHFVPLNWRVRWILLLISSSASLAGW